MASSPVTPAKTLIVCCDGTWVNAAGKDSRGAQPTNVSRLIRALRPMTEGSSPEPQIVNYHAGVGSSGQFLDASMGGTFGLGLDQDIRDMYQFLCFNYHGGDRIVLVGFSRGAFTARSVADLVASVGLLTPAGMDRFYDIFDDYENMADPRRAAAGKFICPGDVLEPYASQKAEAWIQWENRRKTQYRAWLKSEGYTKDSFVSATDGKEQEILIKAVAVWDTVGCLGIPAVPVLGLQGSARQWKFTNTQISSKVENAFQALGLDEPRYDFLPSLWERLPGNTRTKLLQVWFAGSHKNTGGGQNDQQLANLSLAWMCDQLAGVGIAFDEALLSDVFKDGLRYSAVHPFPYVPSGGIVQAVGELGHQGVELVSSLFSSHKHSSEHKQHEAEANAAAAAAARKGRIPLRWAKSGVLGEAALISLQGPPSRLVRDIADCPGKYKHNHPDAAPADLWANGARSWGLGQSRLPTSLLERAAGVTTRKPAMFVRVDPESNEALPDQPLLNTNEQIHASVRVRLACGGLSMDDTAVWTCDGLTGQKTSDEDDGSSDDEDEGRLPLWRLERVDGAVDVSSVQDTAIEGDKYYALGKVAGAGKWQWVFNEKKFATVTAKAAARKKKARIDKNSNNQMPPQGPLQRVLPEALPTGRWERLLLAMTVGRPDVLAWASANPYLNQ
ncbi:hypothetical protein SCUCBS95973_002183 [Sporothrix curviconia]|uniref:T6SS Phospholipase effector Tle1-like catalytic domain-containing protein n=1 Tax=Sporothrix curviconia TaxID=1260050 RepID=A0ABP0B4V9_9PEZI